MKLSAKKKLSIIKQDYVTTYLHYGMALSTVMWNANYKPWINEHFTDLYLKRENSGAIWLDYLEDTKFLSDIADYTYYKAEDLSLDTDYILKAKEFISEEVYVSFAMDQFYYSKSIEYQKYHYHMQLMLYGYDDEQKIFYGVGFDEKSNLGLITISYDEFETCVNSCLRNYKDYPVWVNWYFIAVTEFKNMDKVYKLNVNSMKEDIRNFILSTNLEHKLRSEVVGEQEIKAVFGLNAQYELVNALTELAEGKFVTDYRHIHLIAEHKRLMVQKLNILLSDKEYGTLKEEIIPEYKKLVTEYEVQRKKFLMQTVREAGDMYCQLKDAKKITSIRDQMASLTSREEKLYQRFIHLL